MLTLSVQSQKRKTLATSDDLQSVSSVDSDADDTQTKRSRMQPKTLATSEDLQSVSSVDSDADDTQTKRSRMQPRTVIILILEPLIFGGY